MTNRKSFWTFLPLFLLTLLIAGCASLTKNEQPVHTKQIVLDNSETIGQTFLARYNGLDQINVYLEPDKSGVEELRLHLLDSPDQTDDLRTATISSEQILAPGFYSFVFTPLEESNKHNYYFFIEVMGSGIITVGSAPGSNYLNGAIYRNDLPLDSQLAFGAGYDAGEALLGLAGESLFWIGLLFVACFLFILPGWAVLSCLFPTWDSLSWGEKAGLAVGVSLAIYPILFLWTDLLGIHLGRLYAWLPPLAGSMATIWQWNRARRRTSTDEQPSYFRPASFVNRLTSSVFRHWLHRIKSKDVTLVILLTLIFFTRFWPIRTLDVPMWGDSYQHTMIAQLLVDNRGLFTSWLPFAELQSFTYHFGFHTLVAVFHWLTGLDLPQATLWMGQILNALAILALYPLAVRIGKNSWAGVIAILIAGLLTAMPMYYLNWGRYTQLAGQAILPAVVLLVWINLTARDHDWLLLSLVWITIAGLGLTHYRVLIFAAAFYLTIFVLQFNRKHVLIEFKRYLWHAIGFTVLILPWFFRIFSGKLPWIYSQQMTTPPSQVSNQIEQFNAIGNISGFLPPVLWALLIITIGWGIWRRQNGVALFSLWWFFILLAANPQWLRLPGAGVLTNFAVFIAAYIPAALIIGSAFGGKLEQIHNSEGLDKHPIQFPNQEKSRARPAWQARLLILIIIGLGLLGTQLRLRDSLPDQHSLVTRPDVLASNWINKNLPQNARFLVNSFFAYGDSLIVGSDAGWWLPLLAGRETTLPPINYVAEKGPQPDYVGDINALTAEIQQKGLNSPQVKELLRERQITHIYIGQQQGQVNASGLPLLQIDQLLANPDFHLIYRQDRVWIFEIVE
ncbi:MAG: hypothetical protein A2Z45_07045 [Chloroflexi bacterium RBG_19FT_COMBO_55_16]|nr:MAG: hypothetical protein A2Z45_07045 [Chloroflexi bacterium RBG_19FT_COMBO_55_16]